MLRRIERVVLDIKTHAMVARELSLGLYQAVTVLTRGRAQLDDELGRHDAQVQRELPGF